MAKKLTDRDMLIRALEAMEMTQCAAEFCRGPDHPPVPMASCAAHSEAYLLRQYLKRNPTATK